MTLSEIKQILQERGLAPNKRFGQNFLHDQNLCRWIASQTECESRQGIWEIGPGLGSLTEALLTRGCHVRCIEIDRGFSAYLKERFKDNNQFELYEGDVMQLVNPLLDGAAIVCGNLPYNISSPLIANLLVMNPPPAKMVFTVQREVAERWSASEGSKAYNALSVMVQIQYEIKRARDLPPKVFYPEPGVSSTVVILKRRSTYLVAGQAQAFSYFVQAAFKQKRKQLLKRLGKESELDFWVEVFKKLDLDFKLRAEAISVKMWKQFFEERCKLMSDKH